MTLSNPIPTFSALAARLRSLAHLPAATRPAPYTGADVRALLDPRSPHTDAERSPVLEVARTPSTWTHHLRLERAKHLGHLTNRLPQVVYLHTSGLPIEDLTRRIGAWTTWSGEWALDTACECIATQLNEARAARKCA